MTLQDAIARLQHDVKGGFAADYCVATRPALEVVLAHLASSPPARAVYPWWRPITWQDVRLATGEGPLSSGDVMGACNAELRRRARLAGAPADPWPTPPKAEADQ